MGEPTAVRLSRCSSALASLSTSSCLVVIPPLGLGLDTWQKTPFLGGSNQYYV